MENKTQPKAKKPAVPYKKLVLEAITALNDRTGSSIPAIEKHIKENHPDIELKHTFVRRIVKMMLDNEEIVAAPRHKNSYKISANMKKSMLKKKKVQKLKTSKKEKKEKKEKK